MGKSFNDFNNNCSDLFLILLVLTQKSSEKNIQNFVECDKCGIYIDIKSNYSGGKYICKRCV